MLGNVLYQILTGREPWDDTKVKKAVKAVQHGLRPHVPRSIRESDDPIDVAIQTAMNMW